MDASGLRLVPLGGLGEFGLNALVLEWQEHRLLIDAGVLFPPAELPGVDSIVPDFQYLADRPGTLHGILLTHGHEDHIGALAFALEAAPRARLRQPAHPRLRAPAPAGPRRDRRLPPALARRARHPRPVPRPPHPRRPQRARQPGPRHRDAGRRGAGQRRLQDQRARPAPRAPTSTRCPRGATAACSCCSPTPPTSSSAAAPGARTTCVPAFHDIFARARGPRARLLLRDRDPAHPARGRRGAGRRARDRLHRPPHGRQHRRGHRAGRAAHPRRRAASPPRPSASARRGTSRCSSPAARASRSPRCP